MKRLPFAAGVRDCFAASRRSGPSYRWARIPATLRVASLFAFRWLRLGRIKRVLDVLVMDLANREAPDFTWVADDLAIGSQVLSDEWPDIVAAGIGAVVDCRAEACDPIDTLESLGIAFLHLPTRDAGDFVPAQVVEGVSWIERQLAEGRRTLVHCQAGKGRSVLIGAATLTRRGFSPDEALALIRERRPIVTPTPGQIARLREFAAAESVIDLPP